METILDFLVVFAAGLTILLVFLKFYDVIKARQKSEQILEKFLSSTDPGEFCLNLIYDGYLQTLKVQNHSKDFPDKEHLSKFVKYSNKDVRESMKRVGESYEKFIL